MIIVRYAEIGLKGKNRANFERQLQKNIRHCFKKNNLSFEKVTRERGRIFVYSKEKCPHLKYIFGISSYSYGKEYYLDFETIKKAALEHYTKGTFRITCQRSVKKLLPSTEMEREVGAYIVENTGAKVSLTEPETNIHIELYNENAYIYTEKIKGPGGLPVGAEARVVLLLEKEDSVKAGVLVMKRGCRVDVVNKNNIDWHELEKYAFGYSIKELDEIPEDADAVVVSDTISSLKDYPYFVLRPLISRKHF